MAMYTVWLQYSGQGKEARQDPVYPEKRRLLSISPGRDVFRLQENEPLEVPEEVGTK